VLGAPASLFTLPAAAPELTVTPAAPLTVAAATNAATVATVSAHAGSYALNYTPLGLDLIITPATHTVTHIVLYTAHPAHPSFGHHRKANIIVPAPRTYIHALPPSFILHGTEAGGGHSKRAGDGGVAPVAFPPDAGVAAAAAAARAVLSSLGAPTHLSNAAASAGATYLTTNPTAHNSNNANINAAQVTTAGASANAAAAAAASAAAAAAAALGVASSAVLTTRAAHVPLNFSNSSNTNSSSSSVSAFVVDMCDVREANDEAAYLPFLPVEDGDGDSGHSKDAGEHGGAYYSDNDYDDDCDIADGDGSGSDNDDGDCERKSNGNNNNIGSSSVRPMTLCTCADNNNSVNSSTNVNDSCCRMWYDYYREENTVTSAATAATAASAAVSPTSSLASPTSISTTSSTNVTSPSNTASMTVNSSNAQSPNSTASNLQQQQQQQQNAVLSALVKGVWGQLPSRLPLFAHSHSPITRLAAVLATVPTGDGLSNSGRDVSTPSGTVRVPECLIRRRCYRPRTRTHAHSISNSYNNNNNVGINSNTAQRVCGRCNNILPCSHFNRANACANAHSVATGSGSGVGSGAGSGADAGATCDGGGFGASIVEVSLPVVPIPPPVLDPLPHTLASLFADSHGLFPLLRGTLPDWYVYAWPGLGLTAHVDDAGYLGSVALAAVARLDLGASVVKGRWAQADN